MMGTSNIRVDYLERRLDRAIDRIEEVRSDYWAQSSEIRELKWEIRNELAEMKWELRDETRRAVNALRKELLALVRNDD